MYNFIRYVSLNEGKSPKTLEQAILPYKKDELEPAISEDTMRYHYGKLYKGYVDRFNNGEGDADFNEAGAFLHHILFTQYQAPASSNQPTNIAENFINKYFKSFDNFKSTFEKEAMKIQGSGWVYLSSDGTIKTIKNHQIKMDIVLLIDWWEHAFQFDFGSDKKQYLAKQWNIINWNVISSRVGLQNK
jgi:Fe-Mn family superoxide dismutase